MTSSVIKGYADKLVGAIADLEAAYKSAADKVGAAAVVEPLGDD